MNNNIFTYRFLNNAGGWLVFLISAVVYIVTMEPTTSFWDCGEFILSAYKLQVGHPPGAPVWVMLGRIFTLFAGGDTAKVALMVNAMSALASAFTIMFLFWTITHMVRKVYPQNDNEHKSYYMVIFGSGLLGALAYTFSDTFWFSAVEAEVYAMSSLFTAIVFWAMLRWEESADRPGAGRWLILIAYLMGLSIGVHLLNLLALPALVIIYYFKKYKVTWQGFFSAVAISIALLGVLVFGVIPGVPKMAGWFELFFVNVLGLPFKTGLSFYIVLLIAAIALLINYTLKKKKILLNYIVTSFTVIVIGYSSFAMIMVRAEAAPPMNQNDPSDIFSFIYYINREQYGSVPLTYGHTFDAPAVGAKRTVAGYNKIDGRYEPYHRIEYEYDKAFMMPLPRMYSSTASHIKAYKHWGKIRGRTPTTASQPDRRGLVMPTFSENLRFFVQYQVGFMYWRYFMWNFAGRQNDIQGNGNPMYGNWISGIAPLDNMRLGDQSLMPDDLKKNRGRNRYYLLPLLAGIAGLVWQYKRDDRDFIVVLTFFIMTGVAIIFYLNQAPDQPRERDYAFAGSFYAFSIWIGMGVLWLYELLSEKIPKKIAAPLSVVSLLVAVPLLMAFENWDDHDRSGRYTARDIASNYLNSCDEHGVIFTYGDNDSFPLWYAQDVEGIRTDLRVVNLSYLQAGWYVRSHMKKAYESDPLPLSLTQEQYLDGRREMMPVDRSVDRPFNVKEVLQIVARDEREFMRDISGIGDYTNYLPVYKFLIPVDSAIVVSNGTVPENLADRILSPFIWEFPGSVAYKNDLAVIDLLSGNNWERPVYYSTTVPPAQFRGLNRYFLQTGLAYKLSPVDLSGLDSAGQAVLNTEVMYENMVNRFTWGNASDPRVYLDETNRRMFSNFRRLYGLLAKNLIEQGDIERAKVAIEKSVGLVPPENMTYDYFMVQTAEAMIMIGMEEEFNALTDAIVINAVESLEYVMNLSERQRAYGLDYVLGLSLQTMFDIYNMAVDHEIAELTELAENILNRYYPVLYPLISD